MTDFKPPDPTAMAQALTDRADADEAPVALDEREEADQIREQTEVMRDAAALLTQQAQRIAALEDAANAALDGWKAKCRSVEAERDALLNSAVQHGVAHIDWQQRAEAAEARVVRVTKMLDEFEIVGGPTWFSREIRRALAEEGQ
jgi:uncharacterized coiled-coil DUF342 family protein